MNAHLVCIGGEDHALRIPFLLALRERGFSVTAVSTAKGEPFAAAGIPHLAYRFDRFSSRWSEWKSVLELRRILDRLQPDIVQSFDTKPNLLAPLAARGRYAVVRTINGLGWLFSSSEPRALALRPVYCGLQALVSRWTAATVFQNRQDRQLFRRYHLLGGSTDHLIGSSGIDVANFERARAASPPAAALRAELGLGDAELVMFVGRLTRQKGIATLLDAVPLVAARRPDARFVLVGQRDSEGPFAIPDHLLERAGPLVLATGPRKDVPALLSLASVFAFPTEYREGIPRVLLEAGLARLPIVASDMPGCSDVVEPGRNGHLVPPGSATALADRIVDLLGNTKLARAMGLQSEAIVKERFQLVQVLDQYQGVYARILGGNPRSGRAGPARSGKLRAPTATAGIGNDA